MVGYAGTGRAVRELCRAAPTCSSPVLLLVLISASARRAVVISSCADNLEVTSIALVFCSRHVNPCASIRSSSCSSDSLLSLILLSLLKYELHIIIIYLLQPVVVRQSVATHLGLDRTTLFDKSSIVLVTIMIVVVIVVANGEWKYLLVTVNTATRLMQVWLGATCLFVLGAESCIHSELCTCMHISLKLGHRGKPSTA